MLESDIKYLTGVGPARAAILDAELGIKTFRDLAYFFPTRYVDRSRFYKIAELSGEMPLVQVKGSFINFSSEGEGIKRRLRATFSDGRSLMEVVWFSGLKFIEGRYTVGKPYVLFGKPNFFNGSYSMVHPEIEPFDGAKPPEGLRGLYSVSEKAKKRTISSRVLHTLVLNLFNHAEFKKLPETLPQDLVEKHHLMPLREALVEMHTPTSPDTLRKARERMKFEELFYLELQILKYSKEHTQNHPGRLFPTVGPLFNTYYSKILPFPLTGAQKRVIKEMREDMLSGKQMNRLLQGDVGSGKTVVAFLIMLLSLDNGFQATLMAPTEILATQHYESLMPWCHQLGINCRLLKGSTKETERREILEDAQSGKLHILIGTHALLEERVQFKDLGLAIIDEQHRFGVAQRAKLWNKGEVPPHILVMTATPIPRTLAMTLYGDLKVSVIDELPPGRKPIETRLLFANNRNLCSRLVFSQLREGRQIYFVYPLIQENEKLDLLSLEKGYESVCDEFRDYRVAFVHGKMTTDEKNHQMNLFLSGEARILVATTVIEVGVNVPNASVMVIENAERFGLSQLHQLRGRVGRGADQSYCILMSKENIGMPTRQRLSVMTSTTDGFILAEADLKLRGPGDLEGTMQSGLPINLKVANLSKDGQMISYARDVAQKIIEQGRHLSDPILTREMNLRFGNEPRWREIS